VQVREGLNAPLADPAPSVAAIAEIRKKAEQERRRLRYRGGGLSL